MLDVDGTISRIYRNEERVLHEDQPQWRSWMSVDDDVVDALHKLVEGSQIDVAWLTTWPHDQVAWLIQGPLRGKLSGPYVPWQNWPKQGWRLQSLISYVRDVKPSAVAWADDRAPEDAARRLTAMTEVPSFVVRPNKHVGLTLEDVVRIAAVLERTDQNR
ncbi:HAD domain-containing protein [Microbacterium sp. K24]|uniref:HAD domain-containing protein n=1 Tax=unclassified Microbacterium TaxID=2609290 RepID=UPI00109C9FEF|nr:HAD domain-containing protein [Microbacterium sp. K24]NIG66771.1 hypothetical protein [Microbacterium sp. Be9]